MNESFLNRNKWFFRAVASLGGILGLLTIGEFVERTWRFQGNESSLARAVAETEKLDPDWRWEALNAKRLRPPEARNGASLVPIIKKTVPKNWGQKLHSPDWLALQDVPVNARYPAEVIAEARRECAAAKGAIDIARTLKDRPFGYRTIQLAPDVVGTLLEETNSTRTVLYILRWDAILAMADGNGAQAADSLLAMLNASRSIGDEPLAISQIIRNSTRGVATQCLERALAQGEMPADRLAVLQKAWAEDAEEPLLLHTVRGERAAWDSFMVNLERGVVDYRIVFGKDEAGVSRFRWWRHRPDLSMDHAWLLHEFRYCEEFAREPIEEQVRSRESGLRVPSFDSKDEYRQVLYQLCVSEIHRLVGRFWRSTAEMRCAAAGIACERYRQKNGRWPESLAALVPEYFPAVPLDPFDANPLRLKQVPDGIVIYSIGLDGIDDLGNLGRDNNPTGTDEGFRLWNVKDRGRPAPPPPKPDDAP